MAQRFQPAPRPPAVANLLTPRQAAEWLGIHPKTVCNWIARGLIEAFDVGTENAHRYRIPQAKLLERFQRVKPLPSLKT